MSGDTAPKTNAELAREILDKLKDDGWIRTASDIIVIDEISRALDAKDERIAQLEARNKVLSEALRWVVDHSNDPGVVKQVRAALEEEGEK